MEGKYGRLQHCSLKLKELSINGEQLQNHEYNKLYTKQRQTGQKAQPLYERAAQQVEVTLKPKDFHKSWHQQEIQKGLS